MAKQGLLAMHFLPKKIVLYAATEFLCEEQRRGSNVRYGTGETALELELNVFSVSRQQWKTR